MSNALNTLAITRGLSVRILTSLSLIKAKMAQVEADSMPQNTCFEDFCIFKTVHNESNFTNPMILASILTAFLGGKWRGRSSSTERRNWASQHLFQRNSEQFKQAQLISERATVKRKLLIKQKHRN